MLGDDEKVDDREISQIVIHKKEIGIVARCDALALGFERTVRKLRAKFALLAFQLKFFLAGNAMEIGNGRIVRELIKR